MGWFWFNSSTVSPEIENSKQLNQEDTVMNDVVENIDTSEELKEEDIFDALHTMIKEDETESNIYTDDNISNNNNVAYDNNINSEEGHLKHIADSNKSKTDNRWVSDNLLKKSGEFLYGSSIKVANMCLPTWIKEKEIDQESALIGFAPGVLSGIAAFVL
eukprot:Pgem_evm1s456